ncbi:MAG TPA: WD40 repeat domain-containing protein [Gemmataceae bacterium]|nr:WD40 repeat domain-containing protein [Gemmataceae bacterium]
MTACIRLIALTMGLLLNLPQLGAGAPPRCDQYGDRLPPGALVRIGTTRFRHYASIYSLAYSVDGKLIAGGDSFEGAAESSIVVWDATTGRQLHRLEGHGHVVRALAFASDNTRLAAACGDGSLRIWDVNAEKLIVTIKGSFDAAVFTRDGKVVIGADGKGAGLWNATTGRPLTRLAGLSGGLFSVAVSPNDKQIASCDQNGLILLWDRMTGKKLRRFEIASRFGGYVAFSPDGKRLACGGEAAIYLWDVETGKEVWRIKTPDWRLCSQPFLSGGRILVSYDGAVRFWDAATGEEIRRIKIHLGRVPALALSPDGKIVVTASDQDAVVRRWDTGTGQELQPDPSQDSPITSLCFSPDGKSLAAASLEPIGRLWDAASGKLIRSFTAEGDAIGHLAFSPDGTTLAGAIPKEPGGSTFPISLWDVKTGQLLYLLGKKGLGSTHIAFSADGSTLAANFSDASVVLWDLATRKPRFHPFKGERNLLLSTFSQYTAFVLDPEGKSLALACFLNVRAHLVFWDAIRGRRRFAIPLREGQIAYYPEVPKDFSPDGRRIATRYDKIVRLREAASGSIVRTFEGHGGNVLCAAFSPDGRFLASAGRDRTIRLWDLATGRQVQIFRGHEGAIRCLAFAPDGRRLASGSDDMTALIWSIKEERPAQLPRPRLPAKDLESLWSKLGGKDATAAEQAIWDLVLAGDAAVTFLKDRIHPVRPVPAERFAALVADLDSERFEVREKAQTELIRQGEAAIPLLRQARDRGRPSLELRRRIEQILAHLDESEVMQALRAIDVLEHSDSASARPILERLAGGVAEARLTSEAKAALKRLDRRLRR